MIYFAQSVDGGPIKIGFTENVPRRIKQLESHYHQPLVLLAEMEGDQDTEAEIHERFASARFGRTEQFRPIPELMAFIGRPLLVSPDPDAVEVMEPRKLLIAIKVYSDYKDWMGRFAEREMENPAILFGKAMAEYARVRGFEPPPKR